MGGKDIVCYHALVGLLPAALAMLRVIALALFSMLCLTESSFAEETPSPPPLEEGKPEQKVSENPTATPEPDLVERARSWLRSVDWKKWKASVEEKLQWETIQEKCASMDVEGIQSNFQKLQDALQKGDYPTAKAAGEKLDEILGSEEIARLVDFLKIKAELGKEAARKAIRDYTEKVSTSERSRLMWSNLVETLDKAETRDTAALLVMLTVQYSLKDRLGHRSSELGMVAGALTRDLLEWEHSQRHASDGSGPPAPPIKEVPTVAILLDLLDQIKSAAAEFSPANPQPEPAAKP